MTTIKIIINDLKSDTELMDIADNIEEYLESICIEDFIIFTEED